MRDLGQLWDSRRANTRRLRAVLVEAGCVRDRGLWVVGVLWLFGTLLLRALVIGSDSAETLLLAAAALV